MSHNDIALVAAILEDDTKRQPATEGNAPMIRAAARVRLSGATNYDGTPSGINGDYTRTLDEVEGRPVYLKVGKPSTAMWYHTVEGRHQWVVGPAAKVGTEKMWAYSERPISAPGPEAGGQSPWTLYCYESKAWVRQDGVTVVDLEERAREIEAVAHEEKALLLSILDTSKGQPPGDTVTFKHREGSDANLRSWAGQDRMEAGQSDALCNANGQVKKVSQEDLEAQIQAAVQSAVERMVQEIASNASSVQEEPARSVGNVAMERRIEARAELKRQDDETHTAIVTVLRAEADKSAAQDSWVKTDPGMESAYDPEAGTTPASDDLRATTEAEEQQREESDGDRRGSRQLLVHVENDTECNKCSEGGRLNTRAKPNTDVQTAQAVTENLGGQQHPLRSEAERAAEEMAANEAYADLDKAAVKIQAMARGKSERKRHKERKARRQEPPRSEAERAAEEMAANEAYADLDKAAVKIQAMARGKSERKRHKERRERRQEPPRSEAERAAEEMAANEAYADLDKAAVKIQAMARGKSERKRHKERKARRQEPPRSEAERAAEEMAANEAYADLDKAAVKIQAMARGKSERKRHKERKARRQEPPRSEAERAAEEMAANEAYADLDKAAVKIQAMARGKSERKRHKERKARRQEPPRSEAERAAEEMAANEAYADLDKAAVKIQAMARGMSERKRHKERKARRQEPPRSEAERAAEEMAANEAYADLDKAAVKIQAMARGKSERKRHKERKARRQEPPRSEAERAAEEMAANEAYADLDKAAVKIQAMARGKSERKRLAHMATASRNDGPDEGWVAQMASGMVEDLLLLSVHNLKDDGLVCSVSASEEESNVSSPASRSASQPISAVPSRPTSALAQVPGNESEVVNLVSIDDQFDQTQPVVEHLKCEGSVRLEHEDQMVQGEENEGPKTQDGLGLMDLQDPVDDVGDLEDGDEGGAQVLATEEVVTAPEKRMLSSQEASFHRSMSMDERENMKRMATLQYLNMQDGEGVDILDLQREANSLSEAHAQLHSDAEVLDCNSEPSLSEPGEQHAASIENFSHANNDELWAHEVYAELTEEGAAVRLQRCMRGMIDRLFYRKFAEVQNARRREEELKQERGRQRGLQLEQARKKEMTVKIPSVEPDGYLSAASVHRMQERGEALDKSDVARKAKRIVTKKWAAVDVMAPDSEAVWNVGQVRQIKWKMLGNIQVDRVGIYLYLDGEPIHTIVKAVPNVGKYIFTMPSHFEPQEESYQVLVIAEEPKLPECHAFSSPFTVAPPSAGQLAKVPSAIPTMVITFPVRSGWCWPTGSSYVLSWKSSGVVQNVQIDMLRHGEVAFRIAAGILNSGAFPFAMPPDAPTGEGFQIRVRSVTLKKACGISVPFSIIDRQVAQAVPRRAPVEKLVKAKAHKVDSARLLAPLDPPASLRHTWSAVDARDTNLSQDASLDMRAQTGSNREQAGGWSPSRPRGQLYHSSKLPKGSDMLHASGDLGATGSPAPDASARSGMLGGGGAGSRMVAGAGNGHVLVPNGNLGTPMSASGSGISLPNEVGHRALDIDLHHKPSQFTQEAEDNKITIETVGEPDFETVYNRLRAKYTVKERDTGIWIKPEIERFAGKGQEILQPNTGTEHMMARSLSGTPHLSQVNLPGLTSTSSTRARKASRTGAKSADAARSRRRADEEASDMQPLSRGQQPMRASFMDDRKDKRATREKIISGAEEFLQRRDHMFAKQLDVLRQETMGGHESGKGSILDAQRHANSTGRYSPAFLPPLDATGNTVGLEATHSGRAISKRPHTFGSPSQDMVGKDGYRRYDSARVRTGHANQAIADYYDSVQNHLYGMPKGML